MHTMNITPTRAAIGIALTTSPSTMMRNNRPTPDTNVDKRVRPPDLTLIIDWPIIAQPAIPPKKPVTMLASPCPFISRFLSLGVSVISSIKVAVISDSSSPTMANDKDTGNITLNMSHDKPTSGRWNTGKSLVIVPMSPTVLTFRPRSTVMMDTIIIAAKAEGNAFVILGKT
ncbi:hypothetical protein D3C77_515230 [compost metagenome]